MNDSATIETMQRTDFVLRDLIQKRSILDKQVQERIYVLKNKLESLENCICYTFGVSRDALITKSREADFIFAKHTYRYFLERASVDGKLTEGKRDQHMFKTRGYHKGDYRFRFTLHEVAKLSNCIHTAVIYSCKVVNDLCDTDKSYREKIEMIRLKIMNNKVRFPEI